MPGSIAGPRGRGRGNFSRILRDWRRKRRWSQLELALAAGVSQRHVSFLESGRAQPSRRMILQLSETLEVPLRERNLWLGAAGFAPVFQARALEDPEMGPVLGAVRMMLANHEPFPAMALDRAWNIRWANRAFERLSGMLGPEVWGAGPEAPRNLMRLFFGPAGIRGLVTNWRSIAPLLWCRAEREAEAVAGEEMKQVLAELRPHVDADTLWEAEDAALLPVLPLDLLVQGTRISLFTVIATFGTAQDVTTDELRIEFLFPADEGTERLFRAVAAT